MAKHKKHQHVYQRLVKSFDDMTPFERVVTIIGSIDPISAIPQVTRVYQLRSAEELSLFTWGFGVFSTALWLTYGIRRRSWPLIASSLLWLAADIPIVVAIILYG
jgi:uncharacterized protein with PQ loop repeat